MNETRLNEIIEPAVLAMGYEFVGCQLVQQPGGRVLRIFVDNLEGGVTLDVCERVSRQVSAVMDVEEPLSGAYNLEVSSPGLERPLFTLAHYKQFLGHRIKLRLRVPVNERRNIKGVISEVAGEDIVIQTDESMQMIVSINNIEKANLLLE